MEPRKKRPRISKPVNVNMTVSGKDLFKAIDRYQPPKPKRDPNAPKPQLRGRKMKTLREYFGKFNLSDAEYQRLGMAGSELMKYYNYKIEKRIEVINGQSVEVMTYPKRVLSIIFRLRGFLTSDLKNERA